MTREKLLPLWLCEHGKLNGEGCLEGERLVEEAMGPFSGTRAAGFPLGGPPSAETFPHLRSTMRKHKAAGQPFQL